jgi:two-component system, NarL family, nitrate/nitrite response regulator NarL
MRVKFLIVDDHAVVREGLAAVVALAAPDAVTIEARDCASALATAVAHPDIALVLMDLQMPDATGLSAVETFVARHPDVPLMVVSGSEAPDDVRQALALGALGYAPKSASASTLVGAIRLVLSGEVYVPPVVLQDTGSAGPARGAGSLAGLTERQRDVLRLVCEDQSNKQIAYAVGITEGTVKAHLTAIFRVLGVANRAQAIRLVSAQASSVEA